MKLKNVLFLLCASVLCMAAIQVGSTGGYTSRQVENLGVFKALDVRGDAKVDFMQQAEASVTVSGRENLVNATQVRVENHTLVVSFTEPMLGRDKDKLRIVVAAPEINALAVRQNAEIEVRGALRSHRLALAAGQKGEISIDNVEVDDLFVTASDRAEVEVNHLSALFVQAVASHKAEIELAGLAKDVSLENNGSGDIDAGDLRAVSAKAVVNGSGKVEVFATDTLDAVAMGRGKIEYKGVPSRINPVGNTRKIVQEQN